MEVQPVLTIDLGTIEYYDGNSNQFVYDDVGVVRFEYSLKVLYDWEGKWKKPFLKGELTDEELVDFYMMMALDPIKEEALTDDVMEKLSTYIGDSGTATKFYSFDNGQNGNSSASGKTYTAEELYALMISANVPIEFENRNLNRLLVILRIISSHNSPPKKMSKEEIYRQNRELNAQRRAQLKTKG
jgi:hypothetical protein